MICPMLWQRLLFGGLMIAGVVGLIWADDRLGPLTALGPRTLRHEGAIVTLILATLAAAAAFELCRLAESAGHAPLKLWSVFSSYLIVLVPYLTWNQLLSPAMFGGGGPMPVILTIAFLGTALLMIVRGRTLRAIGDLATTWLILFYCGVLPTYLLRLRLEASAWLLIYVIATVKACDIGAYFTGRLFGRHKLIEWLSPKKTIEGFCGGVVFSIATAWGLAQLDVRCGPIGSGRVLAMPDGVAAAFGFLMAVAGQGGDLVASLFKRDAQAKDSSAMVPAFGGVIDILDSLLPCGPLACWLVLNYC
jgi:phosphatidate cytidylyltransferase